MTQLTSLRLPAGDHALEIRTEGLAVASESPTKGLWLRLVPTVQRAGGEFRYFLPESGAVELSIYDAAGVRMWGSGRSWAEAGEHADLWDGRSRQGKRLQEGVYFVRLELVAPGTEGGKRAKVVSQKLTVLR
jgi:hypothetical protein